MVGDGSYFEPQMLHAGWDLLDTYWWYAGPVTGLALNDNSVDVHWEPGDAVGAPAKLNLWPEYHGLRFENRTVTVAPGGVTDVDNRMWRTPGTQHAWAEGTVALGHRGGTDYFAMQTASPLQHFWSLSVEEQFYVAWPAILVVALAVAARRARPAEPVLAACHFTVIQRADLGDEREAGAGLPSHVDHAE